MQQARLTILGCGSALPAPANFPSAQVLSIRDKQFLIDCGEGAQIRLRQTKTNNNRFGHIFISHLHGDHCFGLIGLIASYGMLNRTADLHIHAHADLEKIMAPQLDYFCTELPYKVIFHAIDPAWHKLIYEDRSLSVYSIPLKHRVPACGFLFKEKPRDRHIIRDMIDFYKIPVSAIPKIKKGEDFTCEDGTVVSNIRLTTAADPAKSYAYCSDTLYTESILPYIEGVDCLYHEATFADSELSRAQKTMHATGRQAAEIAKKANVKKLIIGHFSARYSDKNIILQEAREVFPETILAEDLKSYEF